MLRALLQLMASLGIAFVLAAVLYVGGVQTPTSLVYVRPSESPISRATPSPVASATTTSTTKKTPVKKALVKAPKAQPTAAAQSQSSSTSNEVHRIENPYSFPPLTADSLNQNTRAALVNIFCQTNNDLVNSISGSGVIIDPRGVILTNAHVAQYVLLATQPEVGLQCLIRTGAPAQIRWKADILYMPAAWVDAHAQDISKSKPKGTGANDYALLIISGSSDDSPLPSAFPFIPADTREAVGFTNDPVLLAAYPAEFDAASTKSSLYPTTIFTQIGDLLTFDESTADLMSLGSVALAQSGSSGGAVVNLWAQLVGLISTTSEGTTTADRDLRAITLSYVNRSLQQKTGLNLTSYIGSNPVAKAAEFTQNEAPTLAKQIIHYLATQ